MQVTRTRRTTRVDGLGGVKRQGTKSRGAVAVYGDEDHASCAVAGCRLRLALIGVGAQYRKQRYQEDGSMRGAIKAALVALVLAVGVAAPVAAQDFAAGSNPLAL